MSGLPARAFDWLVGVVGGSARIVSVRPMGRSSTEMHAVDVLDARGSLLRLALRRYVDGTRLGADPWYRPEAEAGVLRILESSGVPAPRLIAADPAGERCDAPALLETRIAGRPLRRRPRDMDAYLRQAAELLLRVHGVDVGAAALLPAYAPYEPPSRLEVPAWTRRPGLWSAVLDVVAGPPPAFEAAFIHRDYHPGNLLRSHGRIAGIVDWPTACRGPRSIDLARMRLNLATDFGLEEAHRFLTIYRRLAHPGFEHHPYWDQLDAVDRAQDATEPRTRAQAASWDRFERWIMIGLGPPPSATSRSFPPGPGPGRTSTATR